MDSFYQELIEEHIMNPNRPRSMQGDIVELLQEHRNSIAAVIRNKSFLLV